MSPRLPFTRLDRYIFRQLFIALVAVTGGLAALIWLTQSLHFVELVVNHGLSLWVFLGLTGLLIPSFVAVILPITSFVVVQFIYQRLAGDRELTVMRSAGLSPFALSRPALLTALIALASCYVLNLWLVPLTLKDFREYQFEIRNRMAAFLLQEGVFTPISDDVTVYVRARDPSGALEGIMVDDARQANSHATVFAERGRLIEGPTGPQVLLERGSRQEIDKKTGRLNLLTFSANTLDLSQNGKGGNERVRDMTEVSLGELLHSNAFVINARDIPKWRAEGHKRLTSPLTCVSFTFIALLSVLTGTFRRHGGILRPLAAIGSVVGLLALGLAIGNMAARHNAMIPLIYVQAIGPALVCAYLLYGPPLPEWRRPRPQPGPGVSVAS
jgi:lipopolysaccharide export system permease protein